MKTTEKKSTTKKTKKVVVVLTVDERESQYRSLRLMVNNFYDVQRLKLSAEGRHNRKKGLPTLLTEADVEQLKIQSNVIAAYEGSIMTGIKHQLRKMPFYQQYLKEFDGIGEVGAAVILSQIDIKKADTVSKVWAFAGLAPVPCRRCKACHNVVEEKDEVLKHASYASFRTAKQSIDEKAKPCPVGVLSELNTYESGKTMKPTKGEKLPYNAWLRSKLIGAIGAAVNKNCAESKKPSEGLLAWQKIYVDYKHRKLTQGWGVSDGHRHNAAIRYMVKMMLLEIWKAWRAFEGLVVRPSYQEEKLGHVHTG